MKKAIIWGAGRFGVCAFDFYREKYNIVCFVDSNPSKVGNYVEGKRVASPEVLRTFEGIVIVASKFNSEGIVDKLWNQYCQKDICIFSVKQELVDNRDTSGFSLLDSISIRLSGGLGNQMFQYALLCALKEQGKKVYVRNMNHPDKLIITKVFPNVIFDEITKEDEERILSFNIEEDEPNRIISYYKENMRNGIEKRADKKVLEIDTGVIQGLFQTAYFAETVKETIKKNYTFPKISNTQISEIIQRITIGNSVSVHIRRGDYLSQYNEYIYNNICTEAYYQKAIELIRTKVSNPVFFVFSNNIQEAQQILFGTDVVYFDGATISDYEDWYDMYLMTQCKHNIIANSTFSWWGAWLNQNEDKIVIAPSKWTNTFDYKDVYPDGWTIIEG